MRKYPEIMFITGSLHDRNSGIYASVFHTARELRLRGLEPLVVGDTGKNANWGSIRTKAFGTVYPRRLHCSPKLTRWLAAAKPVDIVSLQSPWLYNNFPVSRWCKQRNIPYMITVHGCFNSAALKISAWKKKIARVWFVDRVLRGASCFHALTKDEHRAIRELGIEQPVCIIPNGAAEVKQGENTLPDIGSGRLCLYLGRLHRIKGVDALLWAWARTRDRHGWKLALVGPDDGHKSALISLVDNLCLRESVLFAEPGNEQAWLRRADFFVLPSRSEGFAISPLEAMACKVPVLLTKECHFGEVENSGAGYVTGCLPNELQKGLEKMMSISDAARKSMGEKGGNLVTSDYRWSQVADKLLAVYEWMLCHRNPPPWLVFN